MPKINIAPKCLPNIDKVYFKGMTKKFTVAWGPKAYNAPKFIPNIDKGYFKGTTKP